MTDPARGASPEEPAALEEAATAIRSVAAGAPTVAASYDAKTLPGDALPSFARYRLLEKLGQGGMGEVWKALQPGLERTVAIKIMAPDLGTDPEFVERFNREAQALARLAHPNIVSVFDFGVEGGRTWFAMEYVDGTNLRQVLREGKLGPERALKLVRDLCDALEFAHGEGVVHRDVKPENILVDRKGRVKIADFGLARIAGKESETQRLTQSYQVMGTPHYMAPEQVETPTKVDHRADLYALGVVFYEMLTGELPIGRFDPPSQKVEVDVRLDEVVLKALEKQAERRYQSAGDVKRDVTRIVAEPAEAGPAPQDRALFEALMLSPKELPFDERVVADTKDVSRNPLVAKTPAEIDEVLAHVAKEGLGSISAADVRRAYLVGLSFSRGQPAYALVEFKEEAAARLAEELADLGPDRSARWVHRRGALVVFAYQGGGFTFEHLVNGLRRKLGLPEDDLEGLLPLEVPVYYEPRGFPKARTFREARSWVFDLGIDDDPWSETGAKRADRGGPDERLYEYRWAWGEDKASDDAYVRLGYVVARSERPEMRAAILEKWRRMGGDPVERPPFVGAVLWRVREPSSGAPAPFIERAHGAIQELGRLLRDRLGAGPAAPRLSLERLGLSFEELRVEGWSTELDKAMSPNPVLVRDPAAIPALVPDLLPAPRALDPLPGCAGAFAARVSPATSVLILEARSPEDAAAVEAALRRALEPDPERTTRIARRDAFVAVVRSALGNEKIVRTLAARLELRLRGVGLDGGPGTGR